MFLKSKGFLKFDTLKTCYSWVETLCNKSLSTVYPFVHPTSDYDAHLNRPSGISSDGISAVVLPIDGTFRESDMNDVEFLTLETIKEEGFINGS